MNYLLLFAFASRELGAVFFHPSTNSNFPFGLTPQIHIDLCCSSHGRASRLGGLVIKENPTRHWEGRGLVVQPFPRKAVRKLWGVCCDILQQQALVVAMEDILMAPDLLTGLAVFAMRILCRCGFLPTGPLWYCTSCNTREEDAVQGGRLQSIRMLTGTKATALGVLFQWPVIGWVVRRSLRPPTVWPDVSVLGASNLRRVVGYDFHHLRKKYDVPSMGQYPTGLIGLEMIWKMTFVLTVILCMAYLEYFTEPAMAATPASSTLRVSWWTRFFLMPAARVRVPGGSPFSQLQRREKDYPDSWKATKTFTFIGRNNETN